MINLKNFYLRHKVLSIIVLLIIAGSGYYFYSSKTNGNGATTYTFGQVTKGSIISTVSSSGQVSSQNQVDIKPKITSTVGSYYITDIKVKVGQSVKKGDILATLDAKDLKSKVQDAKNSLEISQNNLKLKLIGLTQEEIAVAKNSVEAAKLAYDNSLTSLENTKKTITENEKKSQIQLDNTKISLTNAQRAYDNAVATNGLTGDSNTQSLDNVYSSAKSSINSAYVSLRSSIVNADNLLGMNNYGNNSSIAYKYLLGVKDSQSLTSATNSYNQARGDLQKFETSYNATTWSKAEIDQLLVDVLVPLQSMKTMQHDIYTMLINSITSTDLSQTTLDGFKTTASSQESSLLSNIGSIQTATQNISNTKLSQSSSGISSSSSVENAEASLETAKNNLLSAQSTFDQAKLDNKKSLDSANSSVISAKLSYNSAVAQYNLKIAKPRDIDIAALKIQVSQAENSYQQAVEDLNNANITSPFDGSVAKISQNIGDSATSNTAILTMVMPKKLAIISLNEVDTAKIKTGQKATLTFNAVDGLSITGEVAEIENIGTVTQGVVNYSVKISFDTQDERIKPQMSVSATITTDERLDILLVPNSAIKTADDNTSYVEVFNNLTANNTETSLTTTNLPDKKTVVIGLADDTNTEITSGLSEGDKIIVKTETATSKTTSTTKKTNSGLGSILGGGGPGR